MADTGVSAQGSVATGSASTIFTASSSGGTTGTIIGELRFKNGNSSSVVVTVYRNGTSSSNAMPSFTIPANGMAAYENERWALATGETIAALAASSNVTFFLSGDQLS